MTTIDIVVVIIAGLMFIALVKSSVFYYKLEEKEQTLEKALQVVILAVSLFMEVGSYLAFAILRLLGKIS